ncbi:MAG: PD-(D/E)XK nuclease family protein [Planctomycetia bacterium]|nr:PD-(D/E)XK nuclease family protein [Planctomycetia bacterium]
MSTDWSFSANRCFRRCQRQYYFREIAAWHNAKDPLRRECFLLKQLKTPEQWRGLLVHRGIELFVVPALQHGSPFAWDAAVRGTVDLARRQLAFSEKRCYREPGMTKAKAGDDYCALLPHELGEDLSPDVLAETEAVVETALRNLGALDELWGELRGRRRYWAEHPVRVSYDGASLVAQLDLLCFRSYGKPIIVDWKVSDSMGGSDARLQTALYGWAIWQSGTWGVAQPEDADLFEVQLLTPAVVRHRCDAEAVVELEDRIYRDLAEIRSLNGTGRYTEVNADDFEYARNPNSCGPCPFRGLCLNSVSEPPAATRADAAEVL